MSASIFVYFAVVDPLDASTMTYWRRIESGKRAGHIVEADARYSKSIKDSDVPFPRGSAEAKAFIHAHFQRVRAARAAILAEIQADEAIAAVRFAQSCDRCFKCGRSITDPESRVRGVGPECFDSLAIEHRNHVARVTAEHHAAKIAGAL